MAIDPKCTSCGGTEMQPGFIEDVGPGSQGYARWLEGSLKRGIFGGAKRMGKKAWLIDALRCEGCGHLELFAVRELR